MKLYDYLELLSTNAELTATDVDYDVEIYFYKISHHDEWNQTISALTKKIDIKEITENCIICNFSEIIEKNIDKLNKSDLFNCEMSMQECAEELNFIFAGNVSDAWLKKFNECLEV